MLNCPSCFREYQRKSYYDRHIIVCNLINKTKNERKLENEERDDTPTIRELYIVVMELAKKNGQLEERMQEMIKWNNIQKNKINIVDWLNLNYTKEIHDVKEWITNNKDKSLVQREHLDYMFKEDYVTGMTNILKQLFSNTDDRRPFRVFSSKENTLYIYTNESAWRISENDNEFIQVLYLLDKQLMEEFVTWQTEIEDKIHNDKIAVMFSKNVKTVMGGSIAREQLYSRVKKQFYKYIQTDTSSISTYELNH